MSKVELAVKRFNEGYNCCQAMASIYGPELGLDESTALKISTVFEGGLARHGETCGAVIGALMVISLKYSGLKAEDKESRSQVFKIARSFITKFKERNSTINCRELLRNSKTLAIANKTPSEKGHHPPACPSFVADAATILEEVLL